MDKTLQEISVYTNDKYICIKQPDTNMMIDAVVVVNPEQIDILIQWLQEAKKEFEAIDV
jgi:hypothetical protein